MAFSKRICKEVYLTDTAVENIFINEYMPTAPGDYIKVFLLGLMDAGVGGKMSNQEIAKRCEIEVEDVLKAWNYWEKKNLIKKIYISATSDFSYDIEFLNKKDSLYGIQTDEREDTFASQAESLMDQDVISKMFDYIENLVCRPLSSVEIKKILELVKDEGASPELISVAYAYAKKEKNLENVNYISRIISDWNKRGLTNRADVEEYLTYIGGKNYNHRRVFRALGFSRNPTENERQIMDTWFDDMNMSLEDVITACSKTSGISNPNINYVDKVIRGMKNDARISDQGNAPESEVANFDKIAERYYEHLRADAKKEVEQHRRQMYQKHPLLRNMREQVQKDTMEMTRRMIRRGGVGTDDRIKELESEIEALRLEEKRILKDEGVDEGYLDIQYNCPACNDTGIDDEGAKCTCFNRVLNEALKWQKSK